MGSTTTQVIAKSASRLTTSLSARTRHGRAVNAVADFLRRTLRVPEIYLEPQGSLRGVDVLAVDDAGSGDFHAAEVKVLDAQRTRTSEILAEVQRMKLLPFHFKYVVLATHPAVVRLRESRALFSEDGIGRMGLITFTELADGPPKVELLIKPERFRVPQEEMFKLERALRRLKPDMAVRV